MAPTLAQQIPLDEAVALFHSGASRGRGRFLATSEINEIARGIGIVLMGYGPGSPAVVQGPGDVVTAIDRVGDRFLAVEIGTVSQDGQFVPF